MSIAQGLNSDSTLNQKLLLMIKKKFLRKIYYIKLIQRVKIVMFMFETLSF